jgi:hypothetical protein
MEEFKSGLKQETVHNSGKNAFFKMEPFQDFIKFREFKEDDFEAIQQLSVISRDTLIKFFHNYFTGSKDRSLKNLQLDIKTWENQEAITAANVYIRILEKYDWQTAHNLNRILETLGR